MHFTEGSLNLRHQHPPTQPRGGATLTNQWPRGALQTQDRDGSAPRTGNILGGLAAGHRGGQPGSGAGHSGIRIGPVRAGQGIALQRGGVAGHGQRGLGQSRALHWERGGRAIRNADRPRSDVRRASIMCPPPTPCALLPPSVSPLAMVWPHVLVAQVSPPSPPGATKCACSGAPPLGLSQLHQRVQPMNRGASCCEWHHFGRRP